jgi:uncharacterized membrane protein (DUF4010 family)
LWALVLLFSGLSFVGLIARRAVGPESGYTVAGLLGGVISSTLVTLNFSRESRIDHAAGKSLALGVVAACTVLPARAIILLLIVNPRIGFTVLPYFTLSILTGLLVLFLVRKKGEQESKTPPLKNPLRLLTAIQMVIVFQIALFAFYWIRTQFGATGVLVSSAVAGFTDVDTLLFMIAKQPGLDAWLSTKALIIGVISNTALKLLLAIIIGRGIFRVITAIGLFALSAALIVGLLIF